MNIIGDVEFIGSIDTALLDTVADVCLLADWKNSSFDRHEVSLKNGRLCTLPYAIRRPDQMTYTDTQQNIITACKPIIDCVTTFFPDLKKVRGEVVNLLPGNRLDLHIDNYWFHEHSKRIHVPIYTNLECFQIFEDRYVHLARGGIYEINNRIMHSACNNSKLPRIHLILDLMTNERVAEARANKDKIISRI